MKLWLISFIALLALVEGGQWLAHITLSWPVFLLTGAVLALISNSKMLQEQSLLRVPFASLLFGQKIDQEPSGSLTRAPK